MILILFASWILVCGSGTSAASAASGTAAWPITMSGQLDNTIHPLTTAKGTLLTESQLPEPASNGQVELRNISSAGQIKGHFATTAGTQPLEGPVVTDSEGNSYVETAGPDNGSYIESFNKSGKFRWISSNFQFGVSHLALGWNGLLYVAGSGSNVGVIGLDEATGGQDYSFAVGFSSDLFAYAGGLIAFTNGYEACYYSYTGVPNTTPCVDGGNAINGVIGYSAASGGNGVVFIAGHAGPSQDCQAPVSVEKVTSSGILWTWTAPPLQPIGCGTSLTATPDGGVIVDSNQGSIASIGPSGTMEWIEAPNCSSGSELVVDSMGNVAIPYDCGDGTVGVNFATQSSQVSPISDMTLSSSCGSNQYYSLESNYAADLGSGQLYLGYSNEPGCSGGDHTNQYLMNAFAEPGLSQNEWLALNVPGVSNAPAQSAYVALGDSYSSGEGNAPYFEPNNKCHRSEVAYPTLVDIPSTQETYHQMDQVPGFGWGFLACSSATTNQVKSKQVKAKVDKTNTNWLALSPSTQLVTITVGGDDLNFTNVFHFCYVKTVNCQTEPYGGSATLTEWADAQLQQLSLRLTTLYALIHGRAPTARLIVLGYPQLLPASTAEQDCVSLQPLLNVPFANQALLGLSNSEQDYLRSADDQLNQVISDAVDSSNASASSSFATFVPVASAFAGHEVCGSGPGGEWINGPVVVPIVHKPYYKVESFSFHPNQYGQLEYASLVNAALTP